jgi:cyclophilin family peptidyl-prolyl cis-trans isomerase
MRHQGMRRWPVTGIVAGAMVLVAGCQQSSVPHAGQRLLAEMDTSAGRILIVLDADRAPITVANFVKYAEAAAYDGTVFHRVVPDFVIQGGGWTPDLKERAKAAAAAGRPDVPIRNEWQNGLKNVRGAIAMARDEGPDTATREFFINLKDNPKLDTAREKAGNAGYAVFGNVTQGMDVVDAIGHATTKSVDVPGVTDGSMQNVPVEPVVIRKVTVSWTAGGTVSK